MMLPGYPEGVHPFDVLKDLSQIKVTPKTREKVKRLMVIHGSRKFTVAESKWIRQTARRYLAKIQELHESYQHVRVAEMRRRLGREEFEKVQRRARVKSRLRAVEKLRAAKAEAEALLKEQGDYGI